MEKLTIDEIIDHCERKNNTNDFTRENILRQCHWLVQ